MANLKIDLVNKLKNDKYYDELELIRLAQEPNMNYQTKMSAMGIELGKLAMVNAKLGLVEQYFQEPAPEQAPPAPPAPTGQVPVGVHKGQTHGE